MGDRIIIENGKVIFDTEEGQRYECPESRMAELLREESTPPLEGCLLPDGVKFVDWRPPYLLVVHQYPAQVRQMRWITNDSAVPYGPGATYRPIALSLPYAITFAMFSQTKGRLALGGSNELYFSNQPQRTRSDRSLGYPALLNVSHIKKGKRKLSWICTEHLAHKPNEDWTKQLDNLLHHMWGGGFNLSSEHHEGASWYGLSKGIHPDLSPVEKWEKASQRNNLFALGVPWKPVPMTFGELVDCFFAEHHGAGVPLRSAHTPRKPAGLIHSFLTHMNTAMKS